MIDAAYVCLLPFGSIHHILAGLHLLHDEAMRQLTADDIVGLSTACDFLLRRIFVSVLLSLFHMACWAHSIFTKAMDVLSSISIDVISIGLLARLA
jgi:hypothetical protein